MFRYLKEAFWARPALAGLGAVPWNALAVAGVGMFGFAEHAVWLAGLGLETLYLYFVATNPRFQTWVDARDLARVRATTDKAQMNLAQHLGLDEKRRLQSLEQKISKIETLYRESQNEDYLFDSNREALKKLTNIYLRLLVAQRNIVSTPAQPADQIRQQIAALQRDLAKSDLTPTLRESKQATLQLLQQRVETLQKRDQTLAEIDSDLTRIETQIDLAVEDATLKGRPAAISSNIELVSSLLDDTLSGRASLDSATTTSSSSAGAQLEN